MLRALAIAVSAVLASAGCTTERQSMPPRTATEQLLISTAVDHAVARLEFDISAGTKVLVDADNFEGIDEEYAIGAIRDRLARAGAHLVPTRGEADMVMEIRSGALSIDESRTLIGVPSLAVPVPTTESLQLPEIALWKRHRQQGVAKLAATGYATEDGRVTAATGPVYGFSHSTDYVLLLLITWTTDNLLPKQEAANRAAPPRRPLIRPDSGTGQDQDMARTRASEVIAMNRETESDVKPAATAGEREKPEIEPARAAPGRPRDAVEEASIGSFPASDPPSFTGATVR